MVAMIWPVMVDSYKIAAGINDIGNLELEHGQIKFHISSNSPTIESIKCFYILLYSFKRGLIYALLFV